MKSLFFTLALAFSLGASADSFELGDFAQATHAATSEVESLYGQGSVVAYQVEAEGHELEVEILAKFQDERFVLKYGCHEHGDHFDCHEEGEEQFEGELVSSIVGLSTLKKGELQAFNYVSSRLRPFLTSYKVWAVSDFDDTIWVKFNFNVNGSAQGFFVNCHETAHGGGHSHFHCHTSRTAPLEPQF